MILFSEQEIKNKVGEIAYKIKKLGLREHVCEHYMHKACEVHALTEEHSFSYNIVCFPF